jgi:hypothetical protein
MNPDNFFAAPYGDRQLITFVEDSVLDKTPPKWPDYLENPFKSLDFKNPFANWAMRAMGLTAENMSVTWGVTLAVGVYRLLAVHLPKEAKDPPGGILLIRKSWSPRFILPPGHPRARVVFAGHPAEPQNYIPIADFHRYTFEHKFSEILSILMHLGAKKIEVKHVRGWGQDFSEKLSVGIPTVELGQQAGVSQRDRSAILYDAELSGSKTMSMPDNLVWLPHESTWKQVVEGRTKFGLKTFSLNLQYQEDYGINVRLKACVEKVGLENRDAECVPPSPVRP